LRLKAIQKTCPDINEVLNYRKAMRHAEGLLNTLPLCQRVIKEAHRVLLAEVRGHSAARGEYRKVPNWIGPPGCSIKEARFVPISADHLQEAMGRKFHSCANARPSGAACGSSCRIGSLHPFLDGNGRLGRMFIPLFLHAAGLIRAPMFYISAYFERERAEYYARLAAVSSDEDGMVRVFPESGHRSGGRKPAQGGQHPQAV
jgi:Fic family protein